MQFLPPDVMAVEPMTVAPCFTPFPVRRLLSVGMLLAGVVASGAAQSVRVSGTSWIQLVDLRPLRLDSVTYASTTVDAQGFRTTTDGQPVQCPTEGGYCTLLVSDARRTAAPLVQDLTLSGWGLGQGISVHAHLRGRGTLGSDALPWPRAADHFDALDAYLNIERDRYRLRLGRQFTAGALGRFNFDGVALAVRQPTWSVEGFGGASLVAGLNEGYTAGGMGVVDDLPPDDGAWLLGARARYRPSPRTSIQAEYQRTLRDDRGALYAERASAAATTRLAGVGIEAEWTEDLLTRTVNEARLMLRRAFPRAHEATLELRRSRPFFELWSIWGAFSPVAFDEARGAVRKVTAHGRLDARLGGAYRRYGESNAGLAVAPLREDGWRVNGAITYTFSDQLSAYGDYARDINPGASRSDATAGLAWSSPRWTVGAAISALQSIYEYRLGTGRLYQAMVNGSLQLASDLRVAGDLALSRQRTSPASRGTDWSQRRASLRLEWLVGHDPGAAGARAKIP